MSLNVKPSPKTTRCISKGLYQVSFDNSSFHTDRKTIVNIIDDELYSLNYY